MGWLIFWPLSSQLVVLSDYDDDTDCVIYIDRNSLQYSSEIEIAYEAAILISLARMAERSKAPDSRSGGGFSAWVRIPLLAANLFCLYFIIFTPQTLRGQPIFMNILCQILNLNSRHSILIWRLNSIFYSKII